MAVTACLPTNQEDCPHVLGLDPGIYSLLTVINWASPLLPLGEC
jgi:hypothetical protein